MSVFHIVPGVPRAKMERFAGVDTQICASPQRGRRRAWAEVTVSFIYAATVKFEDYNSIKLHHLKIRCLYPAEFLQLIIIPPGIRCATKIHITANIGEDQSVFFHGFQDHLQMRRICRYIKTCLKPDLSAKRKRILAAFTIYAMPCRGNISRFYI